MVNGEYNELCKIVTGMEIAAKIIEIIKETEEYCFLVSPYFDTWTLLEKELEIAASQKKKLAFLFREIKQEDYWYKKEPRRSFEKDMQKIQDFYDKYHFDIVFIENLHAKI